MPTFKRTITTVNPIEENQPESKVINNPSVPTHKNMSKPILKPINLQTKPVHQEKPKKSKKALVVFGVILIMILGVASGYGLTIYTNGGKVSSLGGLKEEKGLKREVTTSEITKGTKVGVADESTFKDTAEGTIEKGGTDGEGSHKLIRPGGADQTIHMTSSVIDLDQFVGKKVKIWGETFSSQKAGWLMDVGKLEVLE